MSTILSRDALFNAPDLAEEEVFVPHWNGAVRIRELTKEQQDRIRENATNKKTGFVEDTLVEVNTFIEGVIEPRFSYEDATRLRKKSADALDFVIAKILLLSNQHEDRVKEAVSRFPEGSHVPTPVRVGGTVGNDGVPVEEVHDGERVRGVGGVRPGPSGGAGEAGRAAEPLTIKTPMGDVIVE